nr:molybdate ABC transporter substrate-binding protein [uncultured Moellerella sp.]
MQIILFAAGSLRAILPTIIDEYQQLTKHKVICHYGPAGLLRQKIEAGAQCDLFLSANEAHTKILQQENRALKTQAFISNSLCLTTDKKWLNADDNWLSLLAKPALRIGISTPGADPSGDYSIQLFERIATCHSQLADSIRARAISLVGGPNSATIPQGMLAAQWIITSGQAEIFIGYQHYRQQIEKIANLVVCDIDKAFNIRALYCLALLSENGNELANHLISDSAQHHFISAGFLPIK